MGRRVSIIHALVVPRVLPAHQHGACIRVSDWEFRGSSLAGRGPSRGALLEITYHPSSPGTSAAQNSVSIAASKYPHDRGRHLGAQGGGSPYEEPHARAQGGGCEPVDAGNVRLDGTTGTACHDECVCRDCCAVRSEMGSRLRKWNWFVQVELSCGGGELGGGMACSRQLRLAWKLQ